MRFVGLAMAAMPLVSSASQPTSSTGRSYGDDAADLGESLWTEDVELQLDVTWRARAATCAS